MKNVLREKRQTEKTPAQTKKREKKKEKRAISVVQGWGRRLRPRQPTQTAENIKSGRNDGKGNPFPGPTAEKEKCCLSHTPPASKKEFLGGRGGEETISVCRRGKEKKRNRFLGTSPNRKRQAQGAFAKEESGEVS